MEKRIEICGIGNGIVDRQYQVSDVELMEFGVPKCEMRLIDAKQQLELLNKLQNKDCNVCNGGSAANTIDAFAQFGGKAAFLACVGNDKNGDFYFSQLDKFSIEYKDNRIDNIPTGTCFVLITPDSERTMLTSLAASQCFSEQHLSEDIIIASNWLYIEGYMFSEPNAAKAIEQAVKIAKQNNTKIAVTVSDVFIIELFRDRLLPIVEQADLLFCNEKEAMTLANKANSDDAIETVNSYCPNVVMTKGKDGAKVIFDRSHYKIEACDTNVVDTTGAGDMFAGAFLYGMLHFNDIMKAGKFASYSSSKIIAQLGARYEGSLKELLTSEIYL